MRDEKERGVLFVYDTVNVFLQFEVFIARSVSERNAANQYFRFPTFVHLTLAHPISLVSFPALGLCPNSPTLLQQTGSTLDWP